MGFSNVSFAKRRDGPYVPWSALYGDIASAYCLVIELRSTTTLVSMATSPSIPEYHLDASPIDEEDLSKDASTTVSRTPDIAGPSRTRRVEVISRHPYIINIPLNPRRQGAHGCSRFRPRYS